MFADRADKPNSVADDHLSGLAIAGELERHSGGAKRRRHGLARG